MKKGRKLFLVGIAVTIIAFIWGLERGTRLLLASHLELNTIEVRGFQRTDQEQIMEAAAVPLKTPVFQLDLKEIAERVETLPWVRSCEVRRVLPDKLSVRVIERQPVALIRMVNLYYVDEDGTPFKEPAPGGRTRHRKRMKEKSSSARPCGSSGRCRTTRISPERASPRSTSMHSAP